MKIFCIASIIATASATSKTVVDLAATPPPQSSMRNHIPAHCLDLCPEEHCNSPEDQDKFECADCVACIFPCGDSCADDEHCDDVTDPASPVCVADPCGGCADDEHCDDSDPNAGPMCITMSMS